MNPYEAGSLAVRDEEQPGQPGYVRAALHCETFVTLYYILVLAALLTSASRIDLVRQALGVAAAATALVALLGFVLAGIGVFVIPKGRVRLARAALVNGLGAILPAWALLTAISEAFLQY